MARIKDSSVETVKASADIVEVVSAYTNLRKAGARYTGRCPFHEERTPSFSVNPVEKFYICFGCGAKGDLIRFVREKESLDFVGAIEWLADRFNISLEYEEASPEVEARRHRRERLYALLEQAAKFYERFLWDSESGAPARDYLASRGLGEEVCRLYRLGLAPGGAELARRAREKGYTDAELTAAGLLNRRGNDYFARRLLFPLAEARGRVVGFQARILHEDDPLKAKYVNSPEGELFRKGDLLYGLDRARAAIAKQGRAVVVEGNPDVLAVRQAGIEPVVASMGTALTERQLKELARLTHRIYLCFDADAAGEAATIRGMELAAAQGFEIRVVTLPAGKDPADVAAEFERHLGEAAPYAIHRVRVELDPADSLEGNLRRLKPVMEGFQEGTGPWLEAVRYAADELQLSPEMIKGLRGYVIRGEERASPKVAEAGTRLERSALAACSALPELVPLLAELSPDHFDDELHRRMREHLVGEREADEELTALRAELDARATSEALDHDTGTELLLRLRERKLRRELATADFERTRELQAALTRIHEAVSGIA